MDYKQHSDRLFRHLISIPFIWMMIFPLVIMDFFLEIYHRICFPLYGIGLISRSQYIKIDRHRLSYLTLWDKVNCAYCGYANGLTNYAYVIAGETEKYWCGIKHAKQEGFHEPLHHKGFLEYGDKKGFEEKCAGQDSNLRRH